MRFSALMGVLDDVELLPNCLAHLERIGVERVAAMDYGSTDGSLDLLRARQGKWLTLTQVGEAGLLDRALHDAEMARATGADWVLFLDADELWLPATGSLLDCPQFRDPSIDLLQVRRFNVALSASGPLAPAEMLPSRHAEIWMYTRAIADFRRHLQSQPLARWIAGVPKHKIAARPTGLARMGDGWHDAEGMPGKTLNRQAGRELLVAHLPFTTPARFRRKVCNIRQTFARHPGIVEPDAAWHWRRWASLESTDAIDAEFELQCLTDGELSRLRHEGSIRSADEVLKSLR